MPSTTALVVQRDVAYEHDETPLTGLAVLPEAPSATAPAVLLLHDAFGISEEMIGNATALARAGHPTFLADLWGGRTLPTSPDEVGPLIGSIAADRDHWMARVAAAADAAGRLPELAGRRLVLLGYCFGGSSALEFLRTGADVAGVVAIHAGLDLLAPDWSAASPASVLVCTGAEDPMATAEMRSTLEADLSAAGMEWQTHLYSDTVHAFTSPKAADSPAPHLFAYNARSAARAWTATLGFLDELTH
jgi:dienelactone hydrolase